MPVRPLIVLTTVSALAVSIGFLIPVLSAQSRGKALLPPRAASAPEVITDDVLKNADAYAADWLMWTRNYRGHRFSPLAQVNRANVTQLAPKWGFSLGTHGAQQCTPIVHRGVMYVTSAQGKLNAIDAKTGELIWHFDSQLPEDATKYGPDANRGVAVYKDRVYWNNIIGTLFCHDAKTGKVIWKVNPDYYRLGYSKTFAPLIVKGRIVTGIGGGEWGVRGYLEARDADTGKRVWKTYTIPAPGEPSSETWPKGSDIWEHGGGPTWITGSYDPELNSIFWTTGNAGPWSGEQRLGLNLYTCCALSLDADTGKIKWHYQFVRNDDWDFDVNQTPILTELDHSGQKTPVLAVANKAGYLWVLDRRNGKFLKATKFSETPSPPFWSTGLDANGQPIESPHARAKKKGDRPFVAPSALGLSQLVEPGARPAPQLVVHRRQRDRQRPRVGRPHRVGGGQGVHRLEGGRVRQSHAPHRREDRPHQRLRPDRQPAEESVGQQRARVRAALGRPARHRRRPAVQRHAARLLPGVRLANRQAALAVPDRLRHHGAPGHVLHRRQTIHRHSQRQRRRRQPRQPERRLLQAPEAPQLVGDGVRVRTAVRTVRSSP